MGLKAQLHCRAWDDHSIIDPPCSPQQQSPSSTPEPHAEPEPLKEVLSGRKAGLTGQHGQSYSFTNPGLDTSHL